MVPLDRGRAVDELPDARADLVQRVDGVQIAHTAGDRDDDRLVSDLARDELAVAVAFPGRVRSVPRHVGPSPVSKYPRARRQTSARLRRPLSRRRRKTGEQVSGEPTFAGDNSSV